jgi:hypothetical protein
MSKTATKSSRKRTVRTLQKRPTRIGGGWFADDDDGESGRGPGRAVD